MNSHSSHVYSSPIPPAHLLLCTCRSKRNVKRSRLFIPDGNHMMYRDLTATFSSNPRLVQVSFIVCTMKVMNASLLHLKQTTMKSLRVPEIARLDDDCFSKRNRGLKERTSCESSTALRNKRLKLDDASNISLKKSLPSSATSSKKEDTIVGTLVAVGENTTNDSRERSGKSLSHGFISVIGRRRVMKDAVTVAIGDVEGYDFFAVYEGDGGAQTANTCRERLHLIVAEEVERRKSSSSAGGLQYWEEVMSASFKKMDEEVSAGDNKGDGKREASALRSIGCTAVVFMVGKDELVMANSGDSTAVLCRGGEVAVPLSTDHKADRPDEKGRVEAAGGGVVNRNVSLVLGVLATSRSTGDQYLKPYVFSDPEVTVSERTELDSFVVIASDGLWDVVSSEFACEVVSRCLNGQLRRRFSEEFVGSSAEEAATMLAELALARGSKDNISVIVVVLKKS